MNIVIVGAGALGSAFGALLSEVGQEVRLVEANPNRVATLREQGLGLITNDGRGERTVRLAVSTLDESVGTAPDLVVVCVKGYHTVAAVETAKRIAGTDTLALSLQNGIGNLEALEAAFGPTRAASGVTTNSAQVVDSHKVRFNFVQGDSSPIPGFAVGRSDRVSDDRLAELCSALRRAGFVDAHQVYDVLPHLWDKLVCNASCNAVAAITGFTAEQIYGNEHTMALMIGLGREVGAVARAKGVRLQFADEPERTFMGMGPSLGKNKLSMLQDVEAGRPTEIDSINGAVCLEGENLGVPTPMNSMVTKLVKAICSA